MAVYLEGPGAMWRDAPRRGGQRHHGYCLHPDGRPAANRTEAKRIEAGHKVAAQNRPGVKVGTPHGYTMAQACHAYLLRMRGKSSFADAARHVQELLGTRCFAPSRLVTAISDDDSLQYRAWCQQQPTKVYTAGPLPRGEAANRRSRTIEKAGTHPRSPATTNRYLGTLRAIL